MNQPKKQHYVPQFLLRNFSRSKGKKAKIWTFDKSQRISFSRSVRHTGHENYFYEATNLDGHELKAEDLTEYVDTRWSPVIQSIIQNRKIELSDQALIDLSYFTAAQIIRVPATRAEMEKLRTTIIEKWGNEVRFGDDERPVSAYTTDDSKFTSIISLLKGVPEYAEILQKKVFLLLEAPSNESFILSDNPVVRHNQLDYGPRGSLGLAQSGIEVYFPISPSFCIQFLCPKMAELLALTEEGQKMRKKQIFGAPILLQPENVTFINSLQLIQSERFLYAAEDSHFKLARSMLRDHPDLANPASSRCIAE